MMKYLSQKYGFSLLELITVVIIIGIIAGFAIPNYRNMVEQAHAKDARVNLMAIHAANTARRSEVLSYWPTVPNQDVAAINLNLRLNIVEQGLTYLCSGNGTAFTCTATRQGGLFTYTVDQNPLSLTNPSCTAGACP